MSEAGPDGKGYQAWIAGARWGVKDMTAGRRNWLLGSLEPAVRARFEARLRRIDLKRGDVLASEGEPVQTVYFPEGALISLICGTPAGDTIQTGMIGWDGALGVFEACGSRVSAFHAEVEVAGDAYALPADAYRELYGASDVLRVNVHRYVEVLLAESRQFVACNALHSAEQRLSRSVLEALERSRDGRRLPITQEALAQMLGVQRTTITGGIANLQRQGVVRAERGVIEVLDTDGLERAACSCREAVQLLRSDIYASDEDVCD